ncbi:MAG TPA: T9SS type A sorting domain-containing protein [Ignavibacteria bacterium]|nr:T9SS type A sorting domain-containing protein [Ignavibacteria bacterium]HQY53344.1 T9SS type A sorting domain-containing protein [Ignavibacteria bacterium]HRB00713.1 T9SS type A sorting domain-containing protein [Ignavibacteria bacterium]
MVGYYHNFQELGQIRRFTLVSDNAGADFGPEYDGGIYGTQFSNVQYLPESFTDYRIIGIENYGALDTLNGTFCYDNFSATNKYKITNDHFNIGGLSFINATTGYSYVNDKLYKSTNSGVNWNVIYAFAQGSLKSNRNALTAFNEIIYTVDVIGNLVTHTLSTNLSTFYDNISTPGSFSFDNVSYNTPSQQYLRGGNSKLNSSLIINPNQSDERIFYKWSDGNMTGNYDTDSNHYYFDMSGTTIANYYKTKQLSTSSEAISNIGQTKVLKDNWGAINQIHQSMNGGIFYTKSYNNGNNYKQEEIINSSIPHAIADGNKNPDLYETKWYGTIAGGYPVNKNMTACWERYNPSTEKTEIKTAVRDYYIASDTVFMWDAWEDANYSDVFTSFNSSPSYNSKPKIFALAMDPGNNLGNPLTYFFIIPHLRPYSGGNKLQVTCRKGTDYYAEFSLDSGDISDFSAIDSIKCSLGYLEINFTYRKGNQILYRNIAFEYQLNLPIRKLDLEGPIDVSSGDGYSSRFKPDISLMNNVPVVSYAASFNANVYVEYEGGGSDLVPVSRYPIVKVQRINNTSWSNYVIYNSNSVQQTPDIEGSNSTLSYIINYSLGNGQFKKVVNVSDYPGYLCQPNTFSGTDSRLVKNSYSGHFGNNLSLLTLSPQNSLQKVDKQNFIITNITSSDSYDVDNIDGVVNLDTIKYSFKLGPILIKEPNGEVEGGTFGIEQAENEQILTGVEFNENLKSYPFLLNETQALLLGCNATYIKDNAYSSISSVPYTVNLYNKSTGLLHRTLFQDTIHGEDSIETEFLRGFFITNIPNGEDSFYVKLEPDNSFDDGNFYINPVYDVEDNGDNPNSSNVAVIFEDNKFESHSENIPQDFSLHQNFPNPFNPSTVIKYDLPKEGFVKIKIYDLTGREIRSLVNEVKQAGSYSTVFNGANLSSGVYFYKLETENFRQIKRMVLLK